MNFLVDTNVFLSMEPYAGAGTTEPRELATRFHQLAFAHGHRICVHVGTLRDIESDSDGARRRHNLTAFNKYPKVDTPPASQSLLDAYPASRAQDEIDREIAGALESEAVSLLVTEDRTLRTRLLRARPALVDRVVPLARAVAHLLEMHPPPGRPPIHVERVACAHIDGSQRIFDPARAQYPDFDQWLITCKQEQRAALVVTSPHDPGRLLGVAILKDEESRENGLEPRRTKLCTLRVAEPEERFAIAELLVKAALLEAQDRRRVGLSYEAHHGDDVLYDLLLDLGFVDTGRVARRGECVLWRPIGSDDEESAALEPAEFNRRFGPAAIRTDVPMYIVPIEPRWCERLFPAPKAQAELFPEMSSCGNGLRKAYLSRSGITQVRPGDLLLFFRTQDQHAIVVIGVVEEIARDGDPELVARRVRGRTVYTRKDIDDLVAKASNELLIILFREARTLSDPWPFSKLIEVGAIVAAPQSIHRLRPLGEAWVRRELAGSQSCPSTLSTPIRS